MVLNPTFINGTTKTFSVANLETYRGRIFTAYVHAIGSGDYVDSETSNKTIAFINSLPEYPNVNN
jgi:hypothetical protein